MKWWKVRMKVSVSDEFATVFPKENVLQASKKLVNKSKDLIHAVVVDAQGKLKGIITKTDLLEVFLSKDKDPEKILVEDIMDKNPRFIKYDADLFDAIKLMVDEEFFTLPLIFDDNKVTGVLSITDSLKLLYQIYHHKPKVDLLK